MNKSSALYAHDLMLGCGSCDRDEDFCIWMFAILAVRCSELELLI